CFSRALYGTKGTGCPPETMEMTLKARKTSRWRRGTSRNCPSPSRLDQGPGLGTDIDVPGGPKTAGAGSTIYSPRIADRPRSTMRLCSPMKLTFLIVGWLVFTGAALSTSPDTTRSIVLEDFEEDNPGEPPARWRFFSSRERAFLPLGPFMNPKEKFTVVAEGGNKFVRAYTAGGTRFVRPSAAAEAQRISLPSTDFDWRLSEYPMLRWDWRARRLPEGAREDKVNDSGGAIYVSFSKRDWLGRPLSIKYVYST